MIPLLVRYNILSAWKKLYFYDKSNYKRSIELFNPYHLGMFSLEIAVKV